MAPVIATVVPDWGSMSGGTRVTLTGSGFRGAHLAVTFGASSADLATVISDTELIVTTPSGPHMPVTVAVKTDGGAASAAIQFRYLAPLYAADGRGVTPGNLYTVDPTNARSTFVGALGVALTGLALSPGGILFGATAAKGGGALVTIDPYTSRVTAIGPLLTAANAPAHTPDLAFEGTRMLGWHGNSLTMIDPATGRVTPFAVQASGGGMGLASAGPGVVLLAKTFNLATVNTTNGIVASGPTLSSNKSVNSLTFVGATLYGSEATSTTPNTSTLVTINPGTGATTIIGALPPNIDAMGGIPSQSPQVAAASPEVVVQAQVVAAAPVESTLRVDARVLAVHEVFAVAGREVVEGERVRRLIPLGALAAFGVGERAILVSTSGDARVVTLGTPGLALTTNHRQELKLVDTREGFHRILGPIVEVRSAMHR
jgi:IPT/TIG domain